jgi:two-component system, OmpR family, alkaline phosphatase synthesis response regulator PhoP
MQTLLQSRVMTRERILVVDDEEDLLELVNYNLSREGYRVDTVGTGEAALTSARRNMPDLIVLDLLLPNVDGLEVCRLLKNDPQTKTIPIIMLTAKGEESDMVTGLELGADDYMTKPFSPRVLLARIKAILRRKAQGLPLEDDAIRIRELMIHPGRHEVLLNGEVLDLTYTEFRLLHYLARKPGWAFSRAQIVDAVKGEDYPVTERSVDVQVAGLRKKLGDYGQYIETVRGVGYRFQE